MYGDVYSFLAHVDAGRIKLMTIKWHVIKAQILFLKCYDLFTTLLKSIANILDKIVVIGIINQKDHRCTPHIFDKGVREHTEKIMII